MYICLQFFFIRLEYEVGPRLTRLQKQEGIAFYNLIFNLNFIKVFVFSISICQRKVLKKFLSCDLMLFYY